MSLRLPHVGMADTLTLDDVEGGSTSRRSWLKYLGIAGGVAGGGWFLTGDTALRPLWLTVAIDPNIEAVTIGDDDVRVELAPDVSGDEWVLAHEYHDAETESVASGSVREFGGEVTISRSHVDSDRFPTRRFQFVLFSVAEVVEQGVATVETRRETGIHIEIPEKEPG